MKIVGIGKMTAWLLIIGALAACASAVGNPSASPSESENAAVHTEHAAQTMQPAESASPSASATQSQEALPSHEASPSLEASPSPSTTPAATPSKPPSSSPSSESSPSPSPSSSATEAEPSADDAAETVVVEIRNFAFSPAELTIAPGTKVKFINRDQVEHSAVADDGSFDTGMLAQDKEKEITFETEGTFSYYCNPHTSMKGKIIVKSPS